MPLLALHAVSAGRPGFGSIVSPDEPGSEPIAHVWHENPIGESTEDEAGVSLPSLVGDLVCFSGWCGEADSNGVVHADVRTWSATGWTAFEWFAKQIDDAADAAGVSIILRPHARHVLADPQSTLAWLKRTEPKRLKILFDPAAWLTPSMIDAAEDHLARAFESFTGHPAVWGTMLTGVSRFDTSDADHPGGELVPCPLGDERSVLPIETILAAVGAYPLTGLPIVLSAESFEPQRARLNEALGAWRV